MPELFWPGNKRLRTVRCPCPLDDLSLRPRQDSNLRHPRSKRSNRNLRHRPGWTFSGLRCIHRLKLQAGEPMATEALLSALPTELPGIASQAGVEPATRSIRRLHHRPGGFLSSVKNNSIKLAGEPAKRDGLGVSASRGHSVRDYAPAPRSKYIRQGLLSLRVLLWQKK